MKAPSCFRPAFLLILAVLCSCGGRVKGNGSSAPSPVPFPVPEIPVMLQQQGGAAVAGYLCEHFWDGFLDTARVFPVSDTLLLGVSRDGLAKAVAEYAYVVDAISSDPGAFRLQIPRICSSLAALMDAASVSPYFFTWLADELSYFFYNPNSPYRNEDVYGPLALWLSESPLVDDVIKGRYRFESGLCGLNQCGSTAADFGFSDRHGRMYSMHGIDAEYVIMFFTNPGCDACRQIIDRLTSFRTLSGLTLEDLARLGKVAVLNIYIDSDMEAWMDYSVSYPAYWHNGYDPYGVLRDNSLYAIRAIPSMYLLDSEKRVLFKDAVPEKIMAYLQARL